MDTISIRLGIEKAGTDNLLETIPAYLTDISEHVFENGNVLITGRLKNMKVSISQSAVIVKDGSLTKFYLDDNLKMLSRGDTQRAFEKMSDCLHLPMQLADVKRLDFGKNMMLTYPVNIYLPYLGTNRHYTRLEQKAGLNYRIKSRELCIYDKISEMKSRGDLIPGLYNQRNVIRYEKRYLKNIAKYFNNDSITVETLYDEGFYMELINDWYNDYLNIQKQKVFKINMCMIKTRKDLYRLGVLALMQQQGGKQQTFAFIKEQQAKGELTKKQAFDLKQTYEQSLNQNLETKESDLITELDNKMKDAIKYFR